MSRKKKSDYIPLSDEEYAALIAKVTGIKSEDEKRFIKLGWQILEAKFRYYQMPDMVELEDWQYDQLEREYDALAKKLGIPPTAADMVGFNQTRPSCALAADKIQERNPPVNPDTSGPIFVASSGAVGDS